MCTMTDNNNNANQTTVLEETTATVFRWPQLAEGEDGKDRNIKEEQEAFVKRFIETERPDLPPIEGVKTLASGYSGSAFFVDFQKTDENGEATTERCVFLRNQLPKHRAWACQKALQEATIDEAVPAACDLVFSTYDGDLYGSLELTGAACDGGEVIPFQVFRGCAQPPVSDDPFPSPEICEKVGAAIAKLHSVDTKWHAPFASKDAYDKELGIDLSKLFLWGHNIYDDELPPMVKYGNNLLNLVLDDELTENGSNRAYLKSIIDQYTEHPVLKASVGYERRDKAPSLEVSTADIGTAHGDLHGANVLLHQGEPVIIDHEAAHIGPAGGDLGTFYQCIRRYSPDHNYDQASALARGYLQERMNQIHGKGHPDATISEDDVDDFLFEIMCWYFWGQIRQAICLFLTIRMGGDEKPPAKVWDFAMKTLTPEFGQKFTEKVEEASTSIDARREFVRTGNFDF